MLVWKQAEELHLTKESLDASGVAGSMCLQRSAQPCPHDRHVYGDKRHVVLSETPEYANRIRGLLANQPGEKRGQVGDFLGGAPDG